MGQYENIIENALKSDVIDNNAIVKANIFLKRARSAAEDPE